MNEQYFIHQFMNAISFLPEDIKRELYKIDDNDKVKIDEIRIRINNEISFTVGNNQAELSRYIKKTIIVNKFLIDNCFNRLLQLLKVITQKHLNLQNQK